ncbi:hypothetical protein BM613_06940 [Sulfoacidibacillus thermotolerans]|uniref:DUF5132 domain-containing protein n=2 Tax=Sulfoacidibacillus thermotolerans TaxID=1765684 RepID=A0A2U3D8W2_SULT2|nr:hypothetical protein BM613_06940 [Sulfoacidibacillus thermotolerans]
MKPQGLQEEVVVKKSFSVEGIAMGIGLGVLAVLLAPVVKRQIRPAGEAIASGIGALAQGARKWYEVTKEEVEDLFAEAQFERMKRSLDQEIEEPVQPPRM